MNGNEGGGPQAGNVMIDIDIKSIGDHHTGHVPGGRKLVGRSLTRHDPEKLVSLAVCHLKVKITLDSLMQ